MKHLRARVLVQGFVQGVAFRASMRYQATQLDVHGWVMNLPDGDVEALIEGEKKNVEEILKWCRQGPPGAHVKNVEITEEPYEGEFQDFEIRYDRP